jgi:1-deoxy-D-xylulose-5-phosphate reductoisomerase
MNKGLEAIEACWFFSVPMERIRVTIHPQSIIHSMVEYQDGALMAQMGIPDMRIPIAYALAFPERLPLDLPPLDLTAMGPLTFEEPDLDRFPCLKLALEAGRIGQSMPAVLNGANEVVVEAFLKGKIRFTAIPVIIEKTLTNHRPFPLGGIQEVLIADAWGRRKAKELMED